MKIKRILIVDDEIPILSVLKNSLKKLGDELEVSTATDGQTALEQLKQNSFDLVVTDYKMAGMDGLELLEAVRALQPDVVTILMTAYGNDKVEAETRRLNTYRYLIKPVEIDHFRQIVKSALNDMTAREDGSEYPGRQAKSDGRTLIETETRRTMGELSRVTIYPAQNEAMDRILGNLMVRCPAQYALVTEVNGQLISVRGERELTDPVVLASLIAGDIAASQEVARVTGQYQHFQFVLREGVAANTFIAEVGEELILFVQVNKDVPLGWARLVISEASHKLAEIMSSTPEDVKTIKLDMKQEGLAEWVDDALNSLWKK
ncbi:MAG: response regulator [Anaerolineaceae bacterium]